MNSMAIRLLNITLTIMLAALFTGCGRSSSNDRPSQGEQIPEDEAVEQIMLGSVDFDECTLDDYAHTIARGEDIDDVQLANMVMHCRAAVDHLDSIVASVRHADDVADTYNVLSELQQARWLDGYIHILRYLNSMTLPSEFAAAVENINQDNGKMARAIAEIEKQQGLNINLNL